MHGHTKGTKQYVFTAFDHREKDVCCTIFDMVVVYECLCHLSAQYLVQGFPTWGTCTPRGAFANLKWYI